MSHERSLSLFPADDSLPTAAADDLFETWWQQYPRRVAKGAARKAFKRVLDKKIATFDQLMNGVMRYGAERAGEDPQYTAHGASWLNGERWLDEPSPKHRKPLSTADSALLGIMEGMDEHEFKISRGAAMSVGLRSPRSDDDFDF